MYLGPEMQLRLEPLLVSSPLSLSIFPTLSLLVITVVVLKKPL